MQLILIRGLWRKKSMKNPIDMTAITKNPNEDAVKTAGCEGVSKEQCYEPDDKCLGPAKQSQDFYGIMTSRLVVRIRKMLIYFIASSLLPR